MKVAYAAEIWMDYHRSHSKKDLAILSLEAPIEQALGHRQAVTGVGRDFEFTPLLAPQPQLATKALDTMYPDAHPVSAELRLQSLRPVCLPRSPMRSANLSLLSNPSLRSQRGSPASAGMKTAGRHPQ